MNTREILTALASAGAMTTKELADALSIESEQASKNINDLRKRGLVSTGRGGLHGVTHDGLIEAKAGGVVDQRPSAEALVTVTECDTCDQTLTEAISEMREAEEAARPAAPAPQKRRPVKSITPIVCAMAIESNDEGLIEVSRVLDRVGLYFGFDSEHSLTRPEAKALASMLLEMSR